MATPLTRAEQQMIDETGDGRSPAGESYRLNPHFRRVIEIVGSVPVAGAVWMVAREAFIPSDPDGEADYEVWQGDEMVAGCSGPRRRAIAEAVHYAVTYQTDAEPCVIKEVTRREVSPDQAHSILAGLAPGASQ